MINMSEALRSCSGERELLESALDTDTRAASIFAHLMTTASLVFCNRLIFGGAYENNTKDKIEILENLKNINKILDKYTIEDNI